ncbi:zinc-binding alcohol dehydrogenase family protein [Flavobacterium circumlabens]|uniref:NADPH:quinone reductase-like Zn-dependent oxidoreductase n=1 Tax=Flavobacterium circumlabens TaxID=2133765 RepID=A0A4Y7U6J3_9FLAO|nr:zinc-binding alcohol dehydrogenase family protein [Flavobacterium circumlabens]TCN51495.1 NADPH:quinone reductase-like Zn-dependent oxidoreductase [Flavobacterium circumlabens]TEB42073.1 zinc-binding alcohol dehydrogenase family protein [Flavobacterium circumlabens]
MKAAVVYKKGELPQYTDFPDPIVENENQVLIAVKAAAVKNLDKNIASGKHYSADEKETAKVAGGDGVGLLEDGTRVYALGVTGMIAEKAIIDKNKMVKVPEGLDDCTAAALPNAVAGSAMALRFRADIQKGETVLINGATGVTGKIAIQLARHYGAEKIIVTGRKEETLKTLLNLGADEYVVLTQPEEEFIAQIKKIHSNTPIDIIIDYLWGPSAELILKSLKGDGSFTPKTRFVSVGSLSGDTIQLSSEILRSVDLQLSGSGFGSWTKKEMMQLITEILPEMFELVLSEKLVIETVSIAIEDIEKAWDMTVPDGKRLVITI